MYRILLFVISLISSFTVFGCSCVSNAITFKQEMDRYDAIFTGVAVKTTKVSGDWSTSFYKTKITVEHVWKNNTVPKSVFIKTSTEQNSCGQPAPTNGNRFLIFGHVTTDGLYATGGCSTFMDLDEVEKELNTENTEEKEKWEAMFNDMWSQLGQPIIIYSL